MTYELVLLKSSRPSVIAASVKTVRSAEITLPRFAAAPIPLGTDPGYQLALVFQFPGALRAHCGAPVIGSVLMLMLSSPPLLAVRIISPFQFAGLAAGAA